MTAALIHSHSADIRRNGQEIPVPPSLPTSQQKLLMPHGNASEGLLPQMQRSGGKGQSRASGLCTTNQQPWHIQNT